MIPILYLHEHAEISGGETSLLLLWEHLDRQRFQPALLCTGPGPLPARARHLGVPAYTTPIPRLRELLTGRGWSCLAAVRAVAREVEARILHGNTPRTNLVAAWVGARSGCRVVWHERTLLRPHEWDVERWCRGLPDRIICNSAAVAVRFGGPGPRVHVIRNGVPLAAFRPGCGGTALREALGLRPDEVAVGIVGNFSPWKRHDLFLQAAASLDPAVHRARILVVGGEVFPANRGQEARLRAETRGLGLEDRVHFLGVRQDMPAVMDALDILVSPAQFEACSRAILEAMAAGTPVVGADDGGNPELIVPGETGLLVPSGDPHALARALQHLIEDAPLRMAMGRAARARAEAAFSIERQVRETEAVYDAILGVP